MVEVLEWIGICGRVLLAVFFFTAPGIAFWLVAAGLVAVIRLFKRSNLYQMARHKVRIVFNQPAAA
jgi:hypothetical protein